MEPSCKPSRHVVRQLASVSHVTAVMDDTPLMTQLECARQVRVPSAFGRYQDQPVIKSRTRNHCVNLSPYDVATVPYINAYEDLDRQDRTVYWTSYSSQPTTSRKLLETTLSSACIRGQLAYEVSLQTRLVAIFTWVAAAQPVSLRSLGAHRPARVRCQSQNRILSSGVFLLQVHPQQVDLHAISWKESWV